ncbi:Membrane transport protein [Dillenia turbinata]|uniref:Auxin efflux carrier component n=1 Tax=Dillenia turbinata TaxID=194707 RepID=A0AAN8YXI9_9MAGN
MVSLAGVYHVVEATVPLYVAMILAYTSVKWLKLFSSEQCIGINKFVAKFSIPLLSFQVVSANNPYKMNLRLIFSDFLQKLLAFIVLAIITRICSEGSLKWIITGLSVSTLPNTLILGIPLLRAMYGNEAAMLLAQIVVLQSMIWYNILLFLFEFNATQAVSETMSLESRGGLTAEEVESKEIHDKDNSRSARGKKLMIILLVVGKKLMGNPNTHATLLASEWSMIKDCSRWGVELPLIVDKSISILSDGGLGMAMFSLGLFMASQARIIACGTRKAIIAMTMKFLAGPALMAAASIAIGLRGTTLRVAIVQAALPQGIVPFVFAKEYNVHPDVLSTGVIFGMLIALPVALAYYFLLVI